jgi:hypothetical protein
MMLERIEQQHQEILHFQESMFEISRIHIESGDPLDKLMCYLEERVFHVTKACHWPEINASGEISPNNNGELETSFGFSENSYFKNNGCVSVFDYRNIYKEKPQQHMYKCHPTKPLTELSPIGATNTCNIL